MIIFCHKCGSNLDQGDDFCSSCGTKISPSSTHKNVDSHKSLKREDLEKKPWYRGLKVFYIIAIVTVVVIIGTISIASIPKKNLDGDLSSISCYNGKSYAPNKNSIYVYGKDLSSSDDEHARILCQYDTTNYYSNYYSGYIAKNYTFYPVYEDMKYGGWIGYTLLAFFIGWLVFKGLKTGFFYILLGEKPEFNIGDIDGL